LPFGLPPTILRASTAHLVPSICDQTHQTFPPPSQASDG